MYRFLCRLKTSTFRLLLKHHQTNKSKPWSWSLLGERTLVRCQHHCLARIKCSQSELLGNGVISSLKTLPCHANQVKQSPRLPQLATVGQLSEVKNWATSGSQLGIVVLKVCIIRLMNWAVYSRNMPRRHLPQSERRSSKKISFKFLTGSQNLPWQCVL